MKFQVILCLIIAFIWLLAGIADFYGIDIKGTYLLVFTLFLIFAGILSDDN